MTVPPSNLPQTTTTRQIVFRILGGCLVMVVLTGVALWYWWSRHGSEFGARSAQTLTEGRTFGQKATASGCVDEVLDRHKRAPLSFSATLQQGVFLNGCLATASGLPALCAQDQDPGLVTSAKWVTSICLAHDLRDPYCSTVLNALPEACRRRVNPS